MKVAVVGAGIGGLFTAWRLQQHTGHEVTLYESSKRAGGRLLTWFPKEPVRKVRGELGGMRYIRDNHLLVEQLVGELGLEPMRFPATTRFSYLRRTYVPSEPPPYRLRDDEKRMTSDQLLQNVIRRVAAENGIMDPFTYPREKWDARKPTLQWNGERLNQIGFWNLMLELASVEGYSYVADALGYYSLTSNWNAAEAMQFIATDFASDEYFTLAEGYSALATKMADQLKRPIVPDMKLLALEREGAQWRLTFANGHVTMADRVVLGVPGRALEMIEFPKDRRLKERIAELQQAVLRIPAFKLFLMYDKNWWPADQQQGRFTTTLPIRQTYNFNVYPDKDHLMVMASYHDASTVPYWQGLTVPGTPPLLASAAAEIFQPDRFSGLLAQNETAAPAGFQKAPPSMVARAQKQLIEATGIRNMPLPYDSAYMDWSQDPYGGGWSFWAPGADVPGTMREMRNLAEGLHVVGDSFSGIQGWVEGALSFTERVLVDEFGLPAYRPNHYLGY